MPMLILIAWRNVWRQKSRSLVIMLSVISGLWAGLFLQGYINGIIRQRIRTAIEKEISHIQLHHPEFKTDYDLHYSIANGTQLLSKISGWPEVKAFSGRLMAKGMVGTASGSAGVKINGIEPRAEDSTTHLSQNLIEGRFFAEDTKNPIVIGEKLLKKLKLRLNSKIVITLVDKDNNIASGAFRIKGVFKTQNTPYDEANVFVRKSDFAALTGTGESVNEIALLLHENEDVPSVASRLKTRFPAVKTETWMEVAPEMSLIVASSSQSMVIYMSIIMLALAFGIINTMLMAVLERTREIGMLMALGMSKLRVFSMILMETIFLVMTAAPIGVLLGTATVLYFQQSGIHLESKKEVFESFGMSEVIYPSLSWNDYQILLQLVVVTTLVSALFPARKALSLDPAEAIRK